MTKKQNTHKLSLALTAIVLSAGAARAYDVTLSTNIPPLTFHGFASQGLLASSDYDYLGYTKTLSGRFSEAGLNVSMDPFPHTHVTAQGFLFDVGNVGQYYPVLDYALVDYSVNDALGFRAGRIIRPEGIYNAVQSVDLARTSVLLPQGMYDARYRDFSGAIDGGSVYGDLKIGKGGDISYEAYGGLVNLAQNGGISRLLDDSMHIPGVIDYYKVNSFPQAGAQLWWNTPWSGLRAGLAAYQAFGFSYDYYQAKAIGGQGNTRAFTDATGIHPSLEYVWHNWTFQAEYKLSYYNNHDEAHGTQFGRAYSATDTWYAGAAYRFNKWFETGVYYTEDYANIDHRDGSGMATPSDAYQKDVALSFRFDPKPWWIIKLEGHCIHGTALLDDSRDNPSRSSKPWYLLAVKTTVSF